MLCFHHRSQNTAAPCDEGHLDTKSNIQSASPSLSRNDQVSSSSKYDAIPLAAMPPSCSQSLSDETPEVQDVDNMQGYVRLVQLGLDLETAADVAFQQLSVSVRFGYENSDLGVGFARGHKGISSPGELSRDAIRLLSCT